MTPCSVIGRIERPVLTKGCCCMHQENRPWKGQAASSLLAVQMLNTCTYCISGRACHCHILPDLTSTALHRQHRTMSLTATQHLVGGAQGAEHTHARSAERKVYAVRCHDKIFCTQKQPKSAYLAGHQQPGSKPDSSPAW